MFGGKAAAERSERMRQWQQAEQERKDANEQYNEQWCKEFTSIFQKKMAESGLSTATLIAATWQVADQITHLPRLAFSMPSVCNIAPKGVDRMKQELTNRIGNWKVAEEELDTVKKLIDDCVDETFKARPIPAKALGRE